jgi:fructokinase
VKPKTFYATGFAAVDILLRQQLRVSAGGTAVNVTLALAELGWETNFAGTVGNDPAGLFLKRELFEHGVSTKSLRLSDAWTTPVVLQDNVRGNHVWRFRCPICGANYAKHRPGHVSLAQEIVAATLRPDVYFFDRATLFSLELAESWRRAGSFVVFEPSSLGRPQLFARAVTAANLVKFSEDRARSFEDWLPLDNTTFIKTLGSSGVQFWSRYGSKGAVPTEAATVVDTAGAGDWTTAGIINSLHNSNYSESISSLRAGIKAGQQLGAAACSWTGVRDESPLVLATQELEQFSCPRLLGKLSHSAGT